MIGAERFVHGPWPVAGPLGTESATVRVPGGPFAVRGLTRPQRLAAEAHFSTGDDGGEALDIEVHRAPPSAFVDIEPRGWEYELALSYQTDRVTIAGWGVCAELRLKEHRPDGIAMWTRWGDGKAFSNALENILRVAIAYRVLDIGGVVLHSAGLVADDGAVLCFGASGAGKSTLGSRAHGAGLSILSDDLNAVAPCAGGYTAVAMPFAGELGALARRDRVALTRLFKLTQGPVTRVTPLPRGRAISSLIAAAPFVNRDADRVSRLFANLETLVAAVPCASIAVSLTESPFEAMAGGTS